MRVFAFGLAAAMAVFLTLANAAVSSREPNALDYFTPEEIARGKAYHHAGYTVFFLRTAAVIALLFLMIYTGLGARVVNFVSSRVSSRILRVLLSFLIFFALYTVVRFPFSLYSSFAIEHSYGFSRQSFGAWLVDFMKATTVILVLWGILTAGLYWLLRVSPRFWWLLGTGAFAVFAALLIFLRPVVFDRMFNEFAPLENTELRKGITRLAGRSGIEVGNVLVMDASRRTSHTNAYFTGLGRTKRVVLYDTLVENHTEPEVLCVVAHEIGHWKCSHICKGYFIGLAGVLIALLVVHFLGGRLVGRMPLGARDLASPATMPLVFLILYLCALVAMPAQNAISRAFERQADRISLELTGDPQTFIEMEVKLSRMNASDVEPSPVFYYWFYTHPSPLERIAAARSFRKK